MIHWIFDVKMHNKAPTDTLYAELGIQDVKGHLYSVSEIIFKCHPCNFLYKFSDKPKLVRT